MGISRLNRKIFVSLSEQGFLTKGQDAAIERVLAFEVQSRSDSIYTVIVLQFL
jgi:hypothetical protein